MTPNCCSEERLCTCCSGELVNHVVDGSDWGAYRVGIISHLASYRLAEGCITPFNGGADIIVIASVLMSIVIGGVGMDHLRQVVMVMVMGVGRRGLDHGGPSTVHLPLELPVWRSRGGVLCADGGGEAGGVGAPPILPTIIKITQYYWVGARRLGAFILVGVWVPRVRGSRHICIHE